MEREEINNMEENLENLENIDKEYKKVSMYLNLSKLGFALCAAAMAMVSFSPIPLLIKVPLIFISSIILINDDCKRVDYLNRRIELRKLKNSYVDTEEMDNVTENKKQNKLGLGKRLKKLFSKDKKETLPLPVDEDTIEVEDLDNEELSEEIKPVKKQGLFSRLFNKNKVEKKETPEDEFEELSPIEANPSIFKVISNLFRKNKKSKEETLPLLDDELEENIVDVEPVEENNNIESSDAETVKKESIFSKIKNYFNKNDNEETLPLPQEEIVEDNSTISNLDVKDVNKINEVNKISRDPRKATIIKMPNLSENIEGKVKYMVNAEDFITQNIIASYLYGQTGEIVKPRTKTVDGEKVKVYSINK